MHHKQSYIVFFCNYIIECFRRDFHGKIPDEHVMKLSDNRGLLFNIGISDLDPKSIKCIEKHKKRDIDVLESVIEIIATSGETL